MHPALEEILDLIEAEGGRLGELAAAVDRDNWNGLPELAQVVASTEWRDRLNVAIMMGVNDGE